MDLTGWQTQMRKGAAELVILAVLVPGEAYGLQILERTQAAGDLVADGALYQLLNRLEREGKLVSRWSHDEGASHPRKYYALTPAGRRLFAQMQGAWDNFSRSVSAIVEKAR